MRTQAVNKAFPGGPAALLSIAWASRQAGDRELERAARRELADVYGIALTISRKPRERKGGPRA